MAQPRARAAASIQRSSFVPTPLPRAPALTARCSMWISPRLHVCMSHGSPKPTPWIVPITASVARSTATALRLRLLSGHASRFRAASGWDREKRQQQCLPEVKAS